MGVETVTEAQAHPQAAKGLTAILYLLAQRPADTLTKDSAADTGDGLPLLPQRISETNRAGS